MSQMRLIYASMTRMRTPTQYLTRLVTHEGLPQISECVSGSVAADFMRGSAFLSLTLRGNRSRFIQRAVRTNQGAAATKFHHTNPSLFTQQRRLTGVIQTFSYLTRALV